MPDQERNWWEKRVSALSLTHYRDEEQTYFNTSWMYSDMCELGWEAQYAWIRLLSGPEYVREGFPISRVKDAFESPREFNYEAAIESLLRAQIIIHEGDYYTFPNVVWGAPPEEKEASA